MASSEGWLRRGGAGIGLLLCLWLGLWWPVLAAEPVAFVVVVRADSPVPSLTRDEVRDLFLGRTVPTVGLALSPLEVRDEAVRGAFYERLIGWSVNRWRAHWARQVFAGLSQPPTLLAGAEVMPAVLRSPLAVGYLPAGQVLPAQVRVVFELP